MIQSFDNWMISDGCLNRDRLLSPRFGNKSTSLTSETARAAGLPSGRVSTALWPHPGLGAPAPETRTAEPSRGSGGAEAPGETVTTTNSLTSCPLRVGRALWPNCRTRGARRKSEGFHPGDGAPRREPLRARTWMRRRPRMLTATRDISGQFLVVPLQVTAGRLTQPHIMGLQVPFTSYGDSRGESPEGERGPSCCRARAPPSSEAVSTSLSIHLHVKRKRLQL